MNETAIKFITVIIKPWENLNAALSRPYAVQPGISDFTLMTGSLAVSIKHLAEMNGLAIRELAFESQPYRVMSDVADASKHGELKDKDRNNSLVVSSMFEGDGEARF